MPSSDLGQIHQPGSSGRELSDTDGRFDPRRLSGGRELAAYC
ncbi:hypothetical protein [Corynebacterium callunae]|nr:hypothetical protein [Corynebacterium callunae]